MLELFGWNVGMSAFAAVLLIVAALVIGAIAQFIGKPSVPFHWVIVAIAALIGGWIGSEALGAASTWGPAFEGLYLVSALLGAVILGVIVDVVARMLTGGSYLHEPRPI
jgi:uncharacterized membrane protein YeaQ/YmgE (transglycosylase-associated protein family)